MISMYLQAISVNLLRTQKLQVTSTLQNNSRLNEQKEISGGLTTNWLRQLTKPMTSHG